MSPDSAAAHAPAALPPAHLAGVYDIALPTGPGAAIVFCSPHSGTDYRPDFVAAARIDLATLRKSEDSFVDELFAAAPAHGAPLLKALFPRAFVDPNREPFELDPAMFADRLPDYVNAASPRVAGGLGTIARVVANGAEIYRDRLRFAEALSRINTYYRPFHAALDALVAATRARFGRCLVVDCHSMPSVGGPMDRDPGARRVDFVLGDAHGTACSPGVIASAEQVLRAQGYAVARNMPYAGGYTTRHHGRPAAGVEALQIEINRALYMDEERYAKKPYFATLQAHVADLVGALSRAARLDRAA
jgi:N-formylglutamate amidohydrolase